MKKIDRSLFFSVILLILFGILMIYSSSNIWAEYKFHNPYKFVSAQAIFFGVGLFLIFLLIRIPPDFYKKNANRLLFLSLIFLILVLIPGIGSVRNGSRSWFGIGSLGIQPSEFSKIALIIFTAKYLAHNERDIKSIKKGILPLFLVICVFFLLIMLEPDFGTAMVIILTLIVMIFVAGPNLSFFIKIGLVGLFGIALLIAIAPYRMARIVAYLNPWSDPLGSGFQIIQSLYAIAPSGILGTGLGSSVQKNFYLPEPQTDFIFSIIVEELGFPGALFVIGLFVFLFYRSVKIALNESDLFKKYLVFGLSFGILLQATLNLCVVCGIIPTTGVTLPFISYGGSSLLVSMISVGIILGISKKE